MLMHARQQLTSYIRAFGALTGLGVMLRERLSPPGTRVAVPGPGARHPLYLRLRTSDIPTFMQIFVAQEYAVDPVRAPEVIVDAGAYIGLSTVFFAHRYPQARILAIEPEPGNFALLQQNTAPYPHITCLHNALWHEPASLRIRDPGVGAWGYQTQADTDSGGTRVESITLDQLMSDHGLTRIDLLKIDIEGAERAVFAAGGAWLDRVGMIAIELHDELVPGCRQTVEDATLAFAYTARQGENHFFFRSDLAPREARPRQADGLTAVPEG